MKKILLMASVLSMFISIASAGGVAIIDKKKIERSCEAVKAEDVAWAVDYSSAIALISTDTSRNPNLPAMVTSEHNRKMDKLLSKVDAIISEYLKNAGYDIVVDMSKVAPGSEALFVGGNTNNINDELIAKINSELNVTGAVAVPEDSTNEDTTKQP